MPVDIEKLVRVPAFRHLREEYLETIGPRWTVRTLKAGVDLWKEGETAQEMGFVLEGELQVLLGEQEVGRVREGEFLGETTAFARRSTRSATLRAASPVQVAVIPIIDVADLAIQDPVLYGILLDQALNAMSRRIRATDIRIAKLSSGTAEPPEAGHSRISAILKAIQVIRGARRAPHLEPLLRQLPHLKARPPAVYQALAAAFSPKAVAKEEILFREGEEGDSAWLVAEGEVAVVRHIRSRKADVLVQLRPGDLFGTVTLVSPGHRTATCVVTQPGWVYRMDVKAYEALVSPAREAWKECLLATMGIQLRNADHLLSKLQAGSHKAGPLPDLEYEQILRDAGAGGGGSSEG